MTEKFDPAPPDKHAQNPKQQIRRDKADDELQRDLRTAFPRLTPSAALRHPRRRRT